MLGLLKKIYETIPEPVAGFLVQTFGLSYVSSKKAWSKVFELDKQFRRFSEDETFFLLLVENGLTRIIEHVLSVKVPYYADKIERINGNLDVNGLESLEPIDSETVRKSLNSFVVKSVNGYYTTTGGTGRNPLLIRISDDAYYRDYEHVLWSWYRNGYYRKCRKLTLRGVNLGDRLWKYNPIYNELLINIFLMNEKNIDVIVRKIENFNPEFGHGYPSAWTRLSKLIQGRRIRIQLRGVSFVSENFTEEQRKLVEETFSCRVTSFYGHSERAGFAAEISENKGIYYVFPTYGLIEVLDEHGRRVPEGGFGEVTCTTFINKALPLIRYRTGDFARVHKATSSGIPMSLTEISGRWGKDFVYDKYGNRISMTLVNVHSFAQYNFKYIQFRQDTPGKLSVYLVPFEKLRKRDFEDLKREFIEKLKNFDIDFLICDESQIVFSKRGKVPYLVSTLSEEEKS